MSVDRRHPRPLLLGAVSAIALFTVACGDSGKAAPAGAAAGASAAPAAAAAGGELTPFQLQHGIGPLTEELTVGPVDQALAAQGQKSFETKCAACHKMGEKYVGPPLGGVVDKMGPTFVMNMILNPEGMYTKHPEVKKLLGEYMTQMPNQQLSQDEARAVLEYLRTQGS